MTVVESFVTETMYCTCCDGGTSRQSTSSGETRQPIHDTRVRWQPLRPLLLMLTLTAVTELHCVRFQRGVHASVPCEDYYSCNRSKQADLTAACSCHLNCSLYDACCEDVRPSDWRRLALPGDAFVCAVYPVFSTSPSTTTVTAAAFVFLIAKCPSTYGVPSVAKLCSGPHRNSTIKELPNEQWVTDKTTGVTYSNKFCALCYGVPASRMTFWNVSYFCITDYAVEMFGLFGCKNYTWSLIENTPRCMGSYYASCPSGSQQAMQDACVNNPARYVYEIGNFVTYRNYNCSLCASSGIPSVSDSDCVPYKASTSGPFKVDLQGVLGMDSCPKKISSFATKEQKAEITELCPDTVFYTENCSETVNITVLQTSYGSDRTVEYRITSNGVRLLYNLSYTLCYGCQPKTIFDYMLSLYNVTQSSTNETYTKPLYQVEADGSVTVCSVLNPIELPTSTCSGLPNEVSVVLMSLSLIGLAMYAVAYAVLPSLQNLPGQIVLHQSAAFFAAFLLWLLRTPTRHLIEACIALGVLTHFFFLAAFTWTTVYSVEVVRALGFQAYGTGYTKRRLYYTVVGWLVPAVITIIAIAVNWAPSSSINPSYRPSYGSPQCFINNPAPHRIFFTAPLAVMLLIDVVIYVYIVVRLVVISGQTRLVRENHHEKLTLAIKLVFALGVTWIFAVLATATDNCYIAHIFSVLNSLQGVFLFVIFICNATTTGQIRQKMRGPKSLTTGVATELTLSSQGNASSTSSVPPKRKTVLGVNSFSPVSLAMDLQEHTSEPHPP